jgi:DNA-nicking Smr family endonuclease
MRSIDVHGYQTKEALDLIVKFIDKCYKEKETRIEVIHGCNNGTNIKHRVLKMNDQKTHHAIKEVREDVINPGKTIIILKMRCL